MKDPAEHEQDEHDVEKELELSIIVLNLQNFQGLAEAGGLSVFLLCPFMFTFFLVWPVLERFFSDSVDAAISPISFWCGVWSFF